MTIGAEAARQVASEQRRAAEVQSADSYRQRAIAAQRQQQSADEAAAAATYRASLPTIIDGPAPAAAAPADTLVAVPQPSDPQSPDPAASSQSVVPLPQAGVDAWVADESRFDPQGVADLRREWGGEMGVNLGYARHWLHTHLTDEQRERAMAGALLTVPLLRFVAQVAREGASTAPTAGNSESLTPTQPRGAISMAERMTISQLDAAIAKADDEFHVAYGRGDRPAMARANAERERLRAAHPKLQGTTEPDSNHRQQVG